MYMYTYVYVYEVWYVYGYVYRVLLDKLSPMLEISADQWYNIYRRGHGL